MKREEIIWSLLTEKEKKDLRINFPTLYNKLSCNSPKPGGAMPGNSNTR